MTKLTIIILADKSDDLLTEAIQSVEGRYPILIITNNTSFSLLNINSDIKIINVRNDNNFSALRNLGLEKAESEWVLFLDSDERLSSALLQKIPDLIHKNQIDGYWIPRRTYISDDRYLKYGLFYPDYQLRLIRRKSEYKYSGAIHEQIHIPQEKIAHIRENLIHHPRYPKYTSFKDFSNLVRYMKIQSQELSESNTSRLTLFVQGIIMSITLFMSGFFRGKGFMDGWNGFRAHVMLSISIGGAYIMAATKHTL